MNDISKNIAVFRITIQNFSRVSNTHRYSSLHHSKRENNLHITRPGDKFDWQQWGMNIYQRTLCRRKRILGEFQMRDREKTKAVRNKLRFA